MREQDGQTGVTDALTSRRAVLAGGGGVCLALLLAACGGGGDNTDSSGSQNTDSGDTGGGSGDVLAKVSDVPAGGGKVVGTILLVKLAGDTIKAYDAHCTHQGTIVNPPTNGTIVCPNHGSTYSAQDGSVTGPPATRGLRVIDVKVEGDDIVRV